LKPDDRLIARCVNVIAAAAVCASTALAFGASETSSVKASAASPRQGAQEQAPATYLGTKLCESCHREATRDFGQTMMGKIMLGHPRSDLELHGCEGCHGPGSRYVTEMAKAMGRGAQPDAIQHGASRDGVISFRRDADESAETQNAICLSCHDKGAQAFWRASTHAFRGLRCVDCHTLMHKTSPRFQLASALESNPFVMSRPETQVCLRCHLKEKMQMTLPSRMPLFEGLMTCTDCHNPHGGPYPHQLVRATVNETCYICHAEKRGPFLWIHPPVAQDCLNCHEPHGTINRAMLKMRPPRLCQRCHIGTFHPGTPAGPGTVFVFSRNCTNCHSAVHGSNAPGGVNLTR
jgi:DmsE family decaheme c-type cytochrome